MTEEILIREDYLKIIEHIINLQRNAIGDYLESVYKKYSESNSFFIETLYRDIHQVLKDVDDEGDNDLLIKDGDFVIEDGDFKLTGKPSNLVYTTIWLHRKLIEKRTKKLSSPDQIIEALAGIDDFLEINNNTPDYNEKLKEINQKLKNYRKGKKSDIKKTDIPLWLKYSGAIGGIIFGLIGMIFTILKVIDWLNNK